MTKAAVGVPPGLDLLVLFDGVHDVGGGPDVEGGCFGGYEHDVGDADGVGGDIAGPWWAVDDYPVVSTGEGANLVDEGAMSNCLYGEAWWCVAGVEAPVVGAALRVSVQEHDGGVPCQAPGQVGREGGLADASLAVEDGDYGHCCGSSLWIHH